jgi:hypothetical protein
LDFRSAHPQCCCVSGLSGLLSAGYQPTNPPSPSSSVAGGTAVCVFCQKNGPDGLFLGGGGKTVWRKQEQDQEWVGG